ncbi:hypothetical protein BYT27DRAFT_7128364 [Phlegmacium glaucopus]|nr:hypothetical protein BYT27DRAFT_7128364 [Phlegmacium glaucopus]
MGCIHSRAVAGPDLDPAPGSHPKNDTQKTENTADTGIAATNHASNQELERGQVAGADGQVTGTRKVVLCDIEVECSSERASNIDGRPALILTIFGPEGEESATLKNSSETTWSWPGVITLRENMDSLIFIAQSKDGEELGSVSLNKDELQGFLAVQADIEDERQFSAGEAGLLLKLTFTINLFEVDNTTATYSPEQIEQMVKDAAKNPASFLSVLEQLAYEGPEYLHLFGFYLSHRFEETGKVDDINYAIKSFELAMRHTTPDDPAHAIYVHAAGTSYLSRFTLSGNAPDIEQALSFLESSASESQNKEGDVALPERLSRLGIAYRVRFKATGDLMDIEKAISNQQRGVHLTGDNHPDLAARLGALGNSFKARFDRKADLADINSAIVNTEKAISMSTEHHDDMSIWLNNLGSFYHLRFKGTGGGMIKDSDDGIKYQKRAIEIAPKKHPRMASWLNNLGGSYQIRFGKTKEVADIESAIKFQAQAVEMVRDGYMLKPLLLRNLGNSHHARFKVTHDLLDINSAIERHQQAIGLTPKGHADLPSRLGSLGNSLHSRFKQSGDKADVLNAITSFRDAATCHTGSPYIRLITAREWGLLCRLHDPPQSLEAFRKVIELLSQVAGLEQTVQKRHGSLTDISDLTMTAAATAMDLGELGTAVEWLEQGRCLVWSQINQLRTPANSLQEQDSELAQRFLRVSRALDYSGSRQEAEYFDSGGTGDMSHLVATQDEILTHIQLAQEYHTLLTKIRSKPGFEDFLQPPKISDILPKLPLDELRVYDPALADHFLNISRQLKHSGYRAEASSIGTEASMAQKMSLQEVLKKIRIIPEFKDFLRRPGLPADGPVVLINVHKTRCDALALIFGAEAPLHVPLNNFSYELAEELRSLLHGYLSSCGMRSRGSEPDEMRGAHQRSSNRKNDSDIRSILGQLWLNVVKPILDNLAILPHLSDPLRIWWCVTGPLAFLPIHAAGIYGQGHATDDCLLNYAISSYTPTVTTLLGRTKEVKPGQQGSKKLLLISQPNTPGQTRIPGTRAEVRAVLKHLTGRGDVEVRCLEEAAATVNEVKRMMESHSWIHFACHGSQDTKNALQSTFYLHDGQLVLSEIIKKQLDNADLAFLSACRTSTGEEKLSEEAVHLAGGMLAAGYRGVVATMWSIMDQYGPEIAVDFYKHILGGEAGKGQKELNSDMAAYALHYATGRIRKKLGDSELALLAWVPYVHFGY